MFGTDPGSGRASRSSSHCSYYDHIYKDAEAQGRWQFSDYFFP